MTQDKGEQSKIIFDKSELNLGGWGFDELLGLGFGQQYSLENNSQWEKGIIERFKF